MGNLSKNELRIGNLIFQSGQITTIEICIRAQKESLEKAAEKGCDSLELFNSEYEILSKSITNEQN